MAKGAGDAAAGAGDEVAGPGVGAGVAKPAGLETLDPGLDTGRVAAGPGVIVFIPGIGVKFGSGSDP